MIHVLMICICVMISCTHFRILHNSHTMEVLAVYAVAASSARATVMVESGIRGYIPGARVLTTVLSSLAIIASVPSQMIAGCAHNTA